MPPGRTTTPTKNLWVTYLLWSFGGPFGLHHVYLGRWSQAFLWWATIGGFMIGWIRDMWRIPSYVAEANESASYISNLVYKMKVYKTPQLSCPRLAAEYFFAMTVGVAVMAGLPPELMQGQIGMITRCTLVPFCVALAVYMVANIGKEQAVLKWPMFGAYVTIPLFIMNPAMPGSSLSHCALATTLMTNWKAKSWQRTRSPKRSCCVSLIIYGIPALLLMSLWCSAFYHNAYVTTGDGEKIKLKDAFDHIKLSQAWRSPLRTARLVWSTYHLRGMVGAWREFINAMDPEGETNAYEVLGIYPGATEADIKKAYRAKALKYHPDRDDDGASAEEFMAIQKAYDTLSSIQARKARANLKFRPDDTRSL